MSKRFYISNYRTVVDALRSGIGKTAVIFPAAFLVSTALGCMGLGLIFYVKEVFFASPAQIGALSALYFVAYTLGCMFLRPHFDGILPRFVIMIGIFCMFLFATFIRYVPALGWVFLLQFLLGLITALFWPVLMGWLSIGTEGRTLNKALSKFNISWSCGAMLGPILAGWLSERSVEWPILAGSILYISTFFLIAGAALALPAIREDTATMITAPRTEVSGQETHLRYGAWVALFSAFIAAGALLFVFPVWALDELAMPKQSIGLLILMRALFNTATYVTVGRMGFWHFRQAPLVLSQVILAVLFVFLAFTQATWTLAVLMAGIGAMFAFAYTNSIFHGVSGSHNRGHRMAVHETALASGIIIGSAGGGLIYQKYSMPHVFAGAAAVVVIGIFAQLLIVKLLTPGTRETSS